MQTEHHPSPAPRPAFVLGKHRSGTTWLANQLCAHPRIAGVQHADHFGIHESEYFTRIRGRYGDLIDRANYVEFVEVLSASDYFRLAGATRGFLYSLWPASYEEVFRAVMERYATRHGARLWLEKTPGHTPLVAMLARTYPDALFVGIIRDVSDVVGSSLAAAARRSGGPLAPGLRLRMAARLVVTWTYYNRVLQEFAVRSQRLQLIRYEDLRVRNAEVLEGLCAFLGLEYHRAMHRAAFRRNSNFSNDQERQRALSPAEQRVVRALESALQRLPLAALRAMDKASRLRQQRRPLPSWFFRTLPAFPAGIRLTGTINVMDPAMLADGAQEGPREVRS